MWGETELLLKIDLDLNDFYQDLDQRWNVT